MTPRHPRPRTPADGAAELTQRRNPPRTRATSDTRVRRRRVAARTTTRPAVSVRLTLNGVVITGPVSQLQRILQSVQEGGDVQVY